MKTIDRIANVNACRLATFYVILNPETGEADPVVQYRFGGQKMPRNAMVVGFSYDMIEGPVAVVLNDVIAQLSFTKHSAKYLSGAYVDEPGSDELVATMYEVVSSVALESDIEASAKCRRATSLLRSLTDMQDPARRTAAQLAHVVRQLAYAVAGQTDRDRAAARATGWSEDFQWHVTHPMDESRCPNGSSCSYWMLRNA